MQFLQMEKWNVSWARLGTAPVGVRRGAAAAAGAAAAPGQLHLRVAPVPQIAAAAAAAEKIVLVRLVGGPPCSGVLHRRQLVQPLLHRRILLRLEPVMDGCNTSNGTEDQVVIGINLNVNQLWLRLLGTGKLVHALLHCGAALGTCEDREQLLLDDVAG